MAPDIELKKCYRISFDVKKVTTPNNWVITLWLSTGFLCKFTKKANRTALNPKYAELYWYLPISVLTDVFVFVY